MGQFTYTIGGGWGDRIEFFPSWEHGSETQKVCGWKKRIPNKGDLLLVGMTSGNTLGMEFISVEKMNDPPDMFFGEVKALGYL